MLRILLVTLLLALPVTAAGCGGGYSTDDATNRCNVEAEAKLDCFGAASMTSCLNCFEQCGDSCNALPSCPSTYQCPQ